MEQLKKQQLIDLCKEKNVIYEKCTKKVLIQRLKEHDTKVRNSDDVSKGDASSETSLPARPRRSSFTGALLGSMHNGKDQLKTQVYAILLAAFIFYLLYHALYVHLAIFSAYKNPVMWAFLCSVPLNALKDQLKKSLLDDTVDGTDRYQANGPTRKFFSFSRLRYCLFGSFGIFVFTVVGKSNMTILFLVVIAVLGIFLVVWLILSFSSWFIQKLSASTYRPLGALPKDPVAFALLILHYIFYPFKCCLRAIFCSKFVKTRMASILLVCILIVAFCISSFVFSIAIPLEMYDLVQNVQGKLLQYVPEIDNEVLSRPSLSSGPNDSLLKLPGSDQFQNFRKFFKRKKDTGTLRFKLDTRLTITWKFDNEYVIDNVDIKSCSSANSDSWLWTIEGLRRDTEYEANDQDWVQIKHNAQASTYAGIRINIFTKANSTNNKEAAASATMVDVCLKRIVIHGKLDLLKYVEKTTRDHPLVIRFKEIKNIINKQLETDDKNGTGISKTCSHTSQDSALYTNAQDHECHVTPAYEMKRDCVPIVYDGCHNVTRTLVSFTNFSFTSINLCYGQVKNCTKSAFKYLKNVTKSSVDVDIDVLYEQGQHILEASLGKALSFVSVIFDTVYFFFMWMLDTIIFWNVLILLISDTSEDPLKWILKSFLTKEEDMPLIECISVISRSYINGVFQTLLRIVLENAVLTWVPMYITGTSFPFTLSLLAGLLSIFGDIFGTLIMLFPIIELFVYSANKDADFWKFLVLLGVFASRIISPISVHALEKHLLHQEDNRKTILTIVPWSIFGGLQFGMGGIVLGPLISVFPFLILELKEMFEEWTESKTVTDKARVLKKYRGL